MEVLKRDEHGKWNSFEMMKLHYITEGHILRFECHDMDASGVPNLDLITTPDNTAQLEKMSVVEKGYLLLTVAILEIECGSLADAFSPEHFITCDGKWKKPDDLILCPRIDDRLLYPLVDFWELQYYDNECKTIEALQVEDVLQFPLWRRCICQAPASKFSIDSMERGSTKMKMEMFFHGGY